MKMKFCYKCRMPIDFIEDATTHKMVPVDYDPEFVIEGEGEETFLDENGDTVKGRIAKYFEDEGREKLAVFVPHSRTCIYGDRYENEKP